MNELSILMQILSKNDNVFERGATREEILKYLCINDKNEQIHFQNLISNLSIYLELLGLQIRFNPLDSHWFLTFEQEISDLTSTNPFEGKPKLAASLFCVLACCLKSGGIGKLHEIEKLRNKKSTLEDLIELEKMGFLILSEDKTQVKLTPLIGYQLDMEKLFINLSLNLNRKKND